MLESIIFMTIVGVSLGLIIGLASKFFGVQVDERIEQVEEMLPGANCGGCGFAGCAAFAKAVVEGKAEPSKCPVNPAEMNEKIAEYLGMAVNAAEPMVALVKCCGDNVHSPERALYNGVNDCNSAVLVAGATKACQYGCIGLASCSRACPFNAIEINEFNIAVVHPDLCVGCEKCVATCPRDLIQMVPKSAPVHILCNSPERAPIQRKACKKGCIGCRKCAQGFPENVKMVGHLATVDYSNQPQELELVDVCPVNCIHPSVGIDYVKIEKPKAAKSDKPKVVKTLPCHTTLGVEGTSTEAEIKKAFAVKMAQYKPSAMEALSDEEKEAATAEKEKLSKAYKAALALAKKNQPAEKSEVNA